MKNRRAMIALTAILILGALVLVIGLALMSRSLSESRLSLDAQESERARQLANACAEEALNYLVASLSYAGNQTIMIGADSCYIGVLGGSGNANRTIATVGTAGLYTRRVQVNVSQVTPDVVVNSWIDVP